MSRPHGDPRVLVLATSIEARKQIAEGLPADVVVEPLTVDALAEPGPHVDAAMAIALLRGEDGSAGLQSLAAIKATTAGQKLILLLEDVTEPLVTEALRRLAPLAVLPWPAPPSVVRWWLEHARPESHGEPGARPGQRTSMALLGVSRAIHAISEEIKRVAPSRIPILVLGETGTGKELVARAIHDHSDRASGPFVAINSGALPDALLESELFGFERGAFSGATRSKRGLFEQADGGTFFLDEIGDTSPALQVKLLRVLETGETRRLGGTETRRVDVRLVSATHRDLETLAEQGEFRQDLLFRLNTAMIRIPPLRRRRVDIPFLAQHFAEQFGEENARRITLADDFVEALGKRDFPGNVRELRNAVERAIALAGPGEELSSRHLKAAEGSASAPAAPAAGTLKARVEALESELIREALERFDGNRTHAADALGLSRVGLRQKIKRLGIEEEPALCGRPRSELPETK